MSIAEYVIHAKVKNNLILSRILQKAPNVAQFCKESGLSQNLVGKFINMKSPALLRCGDWSVEAERLAQALAVEPEDLFSEEQATASLKSNEAFLELTRRQALEMTCPREALESAGVVSALFARTNLTKMEEKVMRLRYEDDMTLTEAAGDIRRTVERVRQIEAKALRKMREAAYENNLMGESA